MRILLIHAFGHRIGGIEVYLLHLASALQRRGHEIALVYQEPIPAGGQPILDPRSPAWCLTDSDAGHILGAVREWNPDIAYAHQLVSDSVLAPILNQWPAVYFAHTYVGVCVSGGKCWKWPRPRVCRRTLGWGCLVHYFPHGCGGLNPAVMWRLFRTQQKDQDRLRRFQRIATHSDAMREEYIRHGFPADRLVKVPFWVSGLAVPTESGPAIGPDEPLRLLFLGRCEIVKGGGVLLESLPALASRLGRRVELTLAGEGPQRDRWRALASRVMDQEPRVRIECPGWLEAARRDAAFASAHVLVVPSLWPEPFGMTGIEAGFHGVPAVAFDVGGIREWLVDGVNGHLAPGDPPTAQGLTDALAKAISPPAHYERLRIAALAATRRFSESAHLDALGLLFEQCRREFPAADSG